MFVKLQNLVARIPKKWQQRLAAVLVLLFGGGSIIMGNQNVRVTTLGNFPTGLTPAGTACGQCYTGKCGCMNITLTPPATLTPLPTWAGIVKPTLPATATAVGTATRQPTITPAPILPTVTAEPDEPTLTPEPDIPTFTPMPFISPSPLIPATATDAPTPDGSIKTVTPTPKATTAGVANINQTATKPALVTRTPTPSITPTRTSTPLVTAFPTKPTLRTLTPTP